VRVGSYGGKYVGREEVEEEDDVAEEDDGDAGGSNGECDGAVVGHEGEDVAVGVDGNDAMGDFFTCHCLRRKFAAALRLGFLSIPSMKLSGCLGWNGDRRATAGKGKAVVGVAGAESERTGGELPPGLRTRGVRMALGTASECPLLGDFIIVVVGDNGAESLPCCLGEPDPERAEMGR